MRWAFTKDGTFTVKSAYKWLLYKEKTGINPNLPWKNIWNLKVGARIKFFIWQLTHNCLPCAQNLFKKKIINSNICTLCKKEIENPQHLMLECETFSQVRLYLPTLKTGDVTNFAILFFNFANQPCAANQIATIFWLIWKARNNYLFRNIPINNNKIWHQRDSHSINRDGSSQNKTLIQIKWEPPPEGAFKLNIDGAARSNPGEAGIGGIIRDHKGNMISAFSKNIGIASNNKAEVWALYLGIKIANELEITDIIIETDSHFLISCLNRKGDHHPQLETLLTDSTKLMKKMSQAVIKFGYREVNGVADILAKMGTGLQCGEEKYFDHVDPSFEKCLKDDLMLSRSRWVCKQLTDVLNFSL